MIPIINIAYGETKVPYKMCFVKISLYRWNNFVYTFRERERERSLFEKCISH